MIDDPSAIPVPRDLRENNIGDGWQQEHLVTLPQVVVEGVGEADGLVLLVPGQSAPHVVHVVAGQEPVLSRVRSCNYWPRPRVMLPVPP